MKTPSKLRRLLSLYAAVLAIVAALLLGVLLTYGAGDLTSAESRFALGLGLISAAIYGAIFSGLASWLLERNMTEAINISITDHLVKEREEIGRLASRYLPVRSYPATDGYNESFNRELMASIEQSRSYTFFGTTAKHVVTRLRRIDRPLNEVRVAMVDPTFDAAIMQRAEERGHHASNADKVPDQIRQNLIMEILDAIIELFDYRYVCNVNITFLREPLVYRFEMTDDSLFISWYHSPENLRKSMPEALRFSSDSFLYGILSGQTARRFQVSPRVTFDYSTTEAELLQHLSALLGSDRVSIKTLAQSRARRSTEPNSLGSYLISLGYQGGEVRGK